MDNVKIEVIWQCCVCRQPQAPKEADLTHGYHKACFQEFHKEDFTEEDMEELLKDNLWQHG